jgi:hypothetical protein
VTAPIPTPSDTFTLDADAVRTLSSQLRELIIDGLRQAAIEITEDGAIRILETEPVR